LTTKHFDYRNLLIKLGLWRLRDCGIKDLGFSGVVIQDFSEWGFGVFGNGDLMKDWNGQNEF
jgi:hypothetical protein